MSLTSNTNSVSSVDGINSSEEHHALQKRKHPRRFVHFEENVNREVKRRLVDSREKKNCERRGERCSERGTAAMGAGQRCSDRLSERRGERRIGRSRESRGTERHIPEW